MEMFYRILAWAGRGQTVNITFWKRRSLSWPFSSSQWPSRFIPLFLFVFAMTIQPMWHSAIFGPYFVAGAIFSGIAALIVAMNLIRRVYHLEDYLRPVHFNNLGILLLVMTLLWFYFTFTEYLTTYYGESLFT